MFLYDFRHGNWSAFGLDLFRSSFHQPIEQDIHLTAYMQSLKIRNYLCFLRNILERGERSKLWKINARKRIEKIESVVK